MNFNDVLYLVDSDTGEIYEYIDRYTYNYWKWKRGAGIEPNEDFDNE